MLKTNFRTEIKHMMDGNLDQVSDYTKELVYQAKVMQVLNMTWQDVINLTPEKLLNFYIFATTLEEYEEIKMKELQKVTKPTKGNMHGQSFHR